MACHSLNPLCPHVRPRRAVLLPCGLTHPLLADELGWQNEDCAQGCHGDEDGAHAEGLPDQAAEERTEWHRAPPDESEDAVDATEERVGRQGLGRKQTGEPIAADTQLGLVG